MPELETKSKEQDIKKNNDSKEKKAGFLYLIVFFIGIVLTILGTGLFETSLGHFFKEQLTAIYSTAMTLCLSCIGLGKIKFGTLLDLLIIFILFVLAYKLTEVRRNASK